MTDREPRNERCDPSFGRPQNSSAQFACAVDGESAIAALDLDAILNSVSKTHRVVVAEQGRPYCGIGAEICYRIQHNIFDELDAPIARVSQEDVPMPYAKNLEAEYLPNKNRIMAAVRKVVGER